MKTDRNKWLGFKHKAVVYVTKPCTWGKWFIRILQDITDKEPEQHLIVLAPTCWMFFVYIVTSHHIPVEDAVACKPSLHRLYVYPSTTHSQPLPVFTLTFHSIRSMLYSTMTKKMYPYQVFTSNVHILIGTPWHLIPFFTYMIPCMYVYWLIFCNENLMVSP